MQYNTFDFVGIADYTGVVQGAISEAETPSAIVVRDCLCFQSRASPRDCDRAHAIFALPVRHAPSLARRWCARGAALPKTRLRQVDGTKQTYLAKESTTQWPAPAQVPLTW
jgi:hypothetical protein